MVITDRLIELVQTSEISGTRWQVVPQINNFVTKKLDLLVLKLRCLFIMYL